MKLIVMLIGEAFEPSGAGKQVSCTDEADWMGPLANTESSLCHKHQAGPHFHKFINCCLILDGFFFFFFFGSHHSMGTAVDRTLWSGAVLMEDNPVSESPVSGSSKEEGKPCLLLLC